MVRAYLLPFGLTLLTLLFSAVVFSWNDFLIPLFSVVSFGTVNIWIIFYRLGFPREEVSEGANTPSNDPGTTCRSIHHFLKPKRLVTRHRRSKKRSHMFLGALHSVLWKCFWIEVKQIKMHPQSKKKRNKYALSSFKAKKKICIPNHPKNILAIEISYETGDILTS